MVAALQRIASKAIKVQTGAAGHEDPLSASATVIKTLEIVSPAAVLVDLIEYPKPSGWQLSFENPLAILRDVPIEVAGGAAVQGARESRLPHLPRASHEYHLVRKVPADLRQKVARYSRHDGGRIRVFYLPGKNTRDLFLLWGNSLGGLGPGNR